MDIRHYALCHPRFFSAQMPETALRIYHNYRKAGMNMNVKKRSQESLTSKRKPMESWRQYQKLNQSAQKHCPVIRAPVIPRRTRRGC